MKHNVLIVLVLLILASCGGNREYEQLRQVASVVNNNPEFALAKLDSIDLSSLNTADRHYFDFLSVKAADKAYILHTSDSLIRSVINYYESSPDELLPEVYYYGGRVYSDLGDAPQALDYFQQALDCVPTEDIELRGRIVSQMGRLYFSENLHSHAINKVKESINIDTQLKDTFGIAYDYRLLGRIYSSKRQYDSALISYSNGLEYAKFLSANDETLLKIAYANGLSECGQYAKARNLLTISLLDSIPQSAYYYALADYIYVYINTKEYDNVKKFAQQLINTDVNIALKSIAYGAMVDIDLNSHDTELYKNIIQYKLATDSLNRSLAKDEMHYQNSYFNYSIRERENNRLIKEKHQRDVVIVISVFALIVVCLAAAYFVNANKRKRIQLEFAIAKMRRLNNDNSVMRKKLESVRDLKQELAELIQQRISLTDESEEVIIPIEKLSESTDRINGITLI